MEETASDHDGSSDGWLIPSLWHRWRPSLQAAERFGMGVTALLVSVAFAFVGLQWMDQYGYAAAAYGQFLEGGHLLDVLLGTNTFRHPSVWHAVASAVLAGLVVPLVGTFMVHREQALVGETLAHTAFAGVAVGILLDGIIGVSVPYEVVALVASVIGAFVLQWLTRETAGSGDVPLAIVLTGSFALGTLLISHGQGRIPLGVDIESLLFGSPAVVTATGTRLMAGIALGVGATIAFFHKQLLYITFDTPAARAAGIDAGDYGTLLVVLTAVVVVGAMQVLGVILVAGLLVVPVATASQVAGSFRELVILSVLVGELSVAVGMFFSLVVGVPSGGLIITVALCLYLGTVLRTARPLSVLVK